MYRRAVAYLRLNTEIRTDQECTFAHPHQSDLMRIRDGRRIEAATVISDDHSEALLGSSESNLDMFGGGVTSDIAQGFLRDSIDVAREFLREVQPLRQFIAKIQCEAGALGEFHRIGMNRFDQSLAIARPRPQRRT